MSIGNVGNSDGVNAPSNGAQPEEQKEDKASSVAIPIIQQADAKRRADLEWQDWRKKRTAALLNEGKTSESKHSAYCYNPNVPAAHVAAFLDSVGYFQKCPYEVDLIDRKGRNPLHIAASADSFRVAGYLSQKYPHLLNSRDFTDNPIVHANSDLMVLLLLSAECQQKGDKTSELQDLIARGMSYYRLNRKPWFLDAILFIAQSRKLIPENLKNSKSEPLFRVCELLFSTLDPKDPKNLAPDSFSFRMITVFADEKWPIQLDPAVQEDSQKLIQEMLLRKLLGHVQSIRETEQFEYSGMRPFTEIELQRHLINTLSKVKNIPAMTPYRRVFSKLMEASLNRLKILQGKLTPEALVEKIKKGDLVIIPSGYLGHAIDYVFYRNTLVIANRSIREFATRRLDVEIFDPDKISVGLIKEIIDVKSQPYMHFFSRVVRVIRDIRENFVDKKPRSNINYSLPYIDKIEPGPQKVGNCAWASSKASLRAALVLLLSHPDRDIPKAFNFSRIKSNLDEAKRISKLISTAMRLSLHKEYLDAHPEGEKDPLYDPHLVEISTLKLEKHLERTPEIKNLP